MFQTKVAKKIKTHILCSEVFSENRAVYEIMWKNVVETSRPQMTIRRMPIACWISEATNTQSECVTHCFFHCNNGWTKAPEWMLHVHCLSCCKVLSENSEQHNGKKIHSVMEEKLVYMGEGGRSAEEINKRWKSETFCNILSKNKPGEKSYCRKELENFL